MGPEILFLINVASGVAGHYIIKGLEKINKKLAELISSGADEKEIEDYIASNQLGSQVEEYASTIAQDSVVIPMLPKGTPSIELRTEFFLAVIETCFRLSHAWKIDLLLTGSFLGPDTFSLFTDNEEDVPQLVREGPKLELAGVSNHRNKFYILPTSDAENYWEEYKGKVLKYKSESSDYMKFPGNSRCCNVSRITARSVMFKYRTSIRKEDGDLLPFESNSKADGTAVIGEWNEGIKQMLIGISQIQELFVMPEEDFEHMKEISDKMKALANDLIMP